MPLGSQHNASQALRCPEGHGNMLLEVNSSNVLSGACSEVVTGTAAWAMQAATGYDLHSKAPHPWSMPHLPAQKARYLQVLTSAFLPSTRSTVRLPTSKSWGLQVQPLPLSSFGHRWWHLANQGSYLSISVSTAVSSRTATHANTNLTPPCMAIAKS